MRTSSGLAVMVVFLAACVSCPQRVSTGAPSSFSLVWRLDGPIGHGSGTPIHWESGRLYFATARHVAELGDLTAVRGTLRLSESQMSWSHELSDVAVISFRCDQRLPVVRVNPIRPRPGAQCYVAGYPHECGLKVFPVLSQADGSWTGAFAPGMSGGAVLDERGELVAVFFGYTPFFTLMRDCVPWGAVGHASGADLLPPVANLRLLEEALRQSAPDPQPDAAGPTPK